MNNKLILESLSMDLMRVALGLNRGSYKMAERFSEEALKRKNEVDVDTIKPYMKKTLSHMEDALKSPALKKKAEDSLMYSTIIRNYCTTFLN